MRKEAEIEMRKSEKWDNSVLFMVGSILYNITIIHKQNSA